MTACTEQRYPGSGKRAACAEARHAGRFAQTAAGGLALLLAGCADVPTSSPAETSEAARGASSESQQPGVASDSENARAVPAAGNELEPALRLQLAPRTGSPATAAARRDASTSASASNQHSLQFTTTLRALSPRYAGSTHLDMLPGAAPSTPVELRAVAPLDAPSAKPPTAKSNPPVTVPTPEPSQRAVNPPAPTVPTTALPIPTPAPTPAASSPATAPGAASATPPIAKLNPSVATPRAQPGQRLSPATAPGAAWVPPPTAKPDHAVTSSPIAQPSPVAPPAPAPATITAPAPAPAAPAPAPPIVLAVAEKTPDERFQEALALMDNKQYGEAMQAFNTLHNDYPGLSGPLTDLGIIYAQQKKRDEAIDTLTRAANVDPTNAVAQNWLGILYRDGGDYRRAEDAYRKAIAARSDYAFAHYNLAVLYDSYLHQPQDALAHYREYLRLSGGEDLKVQAWVKALELQTATDTQTQTVPGESK